MKFTFYALEDDSLVIMLYELWCKKFNINFILCDNVDCLLSRLPDKKIDICIVDYSMLTLSSEKVVDGLTKLAECSKLFITSGHTDKKTCYGFPIFSKTEVLIKLENHFLGSTKNPTSGSISL